MNRSQSQPLPLPRRRVRLVARLSVCGTLLLPWLALTSASGQVAPAPATQPAAPTASDAERPLLRELDRETRELYRQLQGGVLRVQIPEPQWARGAPVQENNWINKYKLNPEVRQQLQAEPQQQVPNSALGPASNSNTNSLQPTAPAGGANGTNVVSNKLASNGINNSVTSKEANGGNERRVTILVPPSNGSQQATPGPQQSQQEHQATQALQQATQQLPERQSRAGERQNSDRQNYNPGNYGPQNPQNSLPQVQNQAQANGGNSFSPNNIGLLLDEQGHVLVPQFVDREALGDQLIHLTGESGAVLDAKVIGSDQQTGITVLQLLRPAGKAEAKEAKSDGRTHPNATEGAAKETAQTGSIKPDPDNIGKPVRLAKSTPPDGSLVLLLSPGDGTGKLTVWSGGRESGVVINIDGQVAGVNRFGQFLGGPACQLIADQIIRNGAVRRATLGVIITQIDRDDAQRAAQPLLGDRPAVRVDQVMQRSAADQGGLKQGDILLSLDTESVSDIPTLAAAIAAKNGRTRFRVLRGDQVLDLTVNLQQK